MHVYILLIAPVLAPTSLVHANKNLKSVVLQWSIPPRIGRNGIILQYTVRLYVTESVPEGGNVMSVKNFTVPIDNPNFDEPTTSQYTLTMLTPHTHYSWRVAATNEAGMGPFSALKIFWTLQDDGCIYIVNCCVQGKMNIRVCCLFHVCSSWSSVKLVLYHNVKHVSKDNME